MEYTIVDLEEKIVVGVGTNVEWEDPKMADVTNELWMKLYPGGINSQIKNKINSHAIGTYSSYTQKGAFTLAGNEVSKAENDELTTIIIPKGKYAKFEFRGIKAADIFKHWEMIMEMKLHIIQWLILKNI